MRIFCIVFTSFVERLSFFIKIGHNNGRALYINTFSREYSPQIEVKYLFFHHGIATQQTGIKRTVLGVSIGVP